MILVFQKNEFCDERFFEKWNEKYELKNILVFADVYRIIEICGGDGIVIRICMNNFYYFEYFTWYRRNFKKILIPDCIFIYDRIILGKVQIQLSEI